MACMAVAGSDDLRKATLESPILRAIVTSVACHAAGRGPQPALCGVRPVHAQFSGPPLESFPSDSCGGIHPLRPQHCLLLLSKATSARIRRSARDPGLLFGQTSAAIPIGAGLGEPNDRVRGPSTSSHSAATERSGCPERPPGTARALQRPGGVRADRVFAERVMSGHFGLSLRRSSCPGRPWFAPPVGWGRRLRVRRAAPPLRLIEAGEVGAVSGGGAVGADERCADGVHAGRGVTLMPGCAYQRRTRPEAL